MTTLRFDFVFRCINIKTNIFLLIGFLLFNLFLGLSEFFLLSGFFRLNIIFLLFNLYWLSVGKLWLFSLFFVFNILFLDLLFNFSEFLRIPSL